MKGRDNMGKFYNAIMGLVVGDALGVPYEFKKRDSFTATGMTGYGTHNQPPGTWSDDSSLTLATIESLIHNEGINLDDIMNNFAMWYAYGDYTPYGKAFDIGRTTKEAINRYRSGVDVKHCGGKAERDNGNGSLMRILPLLFTPVTIIDYCHPEMWLYAVSSLTHAHEVSCRACWTYIDTAAAVLNYGNKEGIKNYLSGFEHFTPFERVAYLDSLTRDEIKSTGYVVDTLEAALWCFLKTESYRECVLMAVNLGGDTDTIAAVSGGLAGLYYGTGGEKGIPQEWIDQIARREDITELCETFEKTFDTEGDDNG